MAPLRFRIALLHLTTIGTLLPPWGSRSGSLRVACAGSGPTLPVVIMATDNIGRQGGAKADTRQYDMACHTFGWCRSTLSVACWHPRHSAHHCWPNQKKVGNGWRRVICIFQVCHFLLWNKTARFSHSQKPIYWFSRLAAVGYLHNCITVIDYFSHQQTGRGRSNARLIGYNARSLKHAVKWIRSQATTFRLCKNIIIASHSLFV